MHMQNQKRILRTFLEIAANHLCTRKNRIEITEINSLCKFIDEKNKKLEENELGDVMCHLSLSLFVNFLQVSDQRS